MLERVDDVIGDDDIQEIIVEETAFKGRVPSSDFATYLVGATRSITNGHAPLSRRTGVALFTPDCGGKIVIEIVPQKAIQATMPVQVLGVGFTLNQNFDRTLFLQEGERISLRVRKHGQMIDMHARGPVRRAPEKLRQILGRIRCEMTPLET